MKTCIASVFSFFQILLVSGQTLTNLGPSAVYSAVDVCWGENDRVFLSTSSGLYYSDDLGTQWNKVNEFFNTVYIEPHFEKNKHGHIYLADQNSLMNYTTDNGETWQQRIGYISNGGRTNAIGVYGDTIFIGTPVGLSYIYGSEFFMEAVEVPFFADKHVTAIKVRDHVVIVGTKTDGLFISQDLGSTWEHKTPGFPSDFEVSSMELSGNKLFVGTYWNGVYYTEDWGLNWVQKNTGLLNNTISDLYIDGSSIYATTTSYTPVYSSTLDAGGWNLIDNGVDDAHMPNTIAANGSNLILGCWQGVYKSADNGQNWTMSIKGIRDAFEFTSIQAAEDGTIYASASHTGTYRKRITDEEFQPFKKISGGRHTNGEIKNNILPFIDHDAIKFYDLSTDDLVNEVLVTDDVLFPDKFLDTEEGYFLSTLQNGIYHYEDGSWVEYNTGLNSLVIKDFIIHNDLLYAATESGLYKASKTNNDWSKIDIGFADPGVITLVIQDSIMIVAGTDNSSYVSHDYGAGWEKIIDLEFSTVKDIIYGGGRFYASTYTKIFFSDDLGKSWSSTQYYDMFFESLALINSTLYVGATEIGVLSMPVEVEYTITFDPISPVTFGDPDFAPDATASSGASLSFSSSNNTVATVADNTIHIIGAGSSVITAWVEGNANYQPVEQMLTVNKASQIISFEALEPRTVKMPSYDILATATSGLPVTFTSSNPRVATINGNTVTIKHHGTTIITASQPGNNNYLPGSPVAQALLVEKVNKGHEKPNTFFAVWPNPGKGIYSIQLLQDAPFEEDKIQIDLRDAYGRKVNFKISRQASGAFELEFGNFPAGIYFLVIRRNNNLYSERLIKTE